MADIDQSNFHWLSSSPSKGKVSGYGLKSFFLNMNTQLLSSNEYKLLVQLREWIPGKNYSCLSKHVYVIRTELSMIIKPKNGLSLVKKELISKISSFWSWEIYLAIEYIYRVVFKCTFKFLFFITPVSYLPSTPTPLKS